MLASVNCRLLGCLAAFLVACPVVGAHANSPNRIINIFITEAEATNKMLTKRCCRSISSPLLPRLPTRHRSDGFSIIFNKNVKLCAKKEIHILYIFIYIYIILVSANAGQMIFTKNQFGVVVVFFLFLCKTATAPLCAIKMLDKQNAVTVNKFPFTCNCTRKILHSPHIYTHTRSFIEYISLFVCLK